MLVCRLQVKRKPSRSFYKLQPTNCELCLKEASPVLGVHRGPGKGGRREKGNLRPRASMKDVGEHAGL